MGGSINYPPIIEAIRNFNWSSSTVPTNQPGPNIGATDWTKRLDTMEVKVFVDSIPRVVCGVTEETTSQEMVIALAQALGQPGRYTLREKFKDFERCMTPNERILETLERYGEQAKEVQLTLIHNGPSVWDEMSRTKIGRFQPCPPLRRRDAGSRMRGGSSPSLHRQSLPPLSCERQEAEQQKEELKRPKRKSLTLMEEAWEWLESLRKGKVYSTARDKESSKRTDKRNHISLDVCLTVDKDNSGRSSRSKMRGKEKSCKSDLDHQTSCCMGNQTRAKETKHYTNSQQAKSEDEKNCLRETIIYQLSCLQDLQVQIAHIDQQIFELEEKQRAENAEQEAQQRIVEDEMEQIKFWENELKAEEVYEKDLQCQFLEMRAKAVECKAKLEDYKHKIQGLDFAGQNKNSKMASNACANAASKISTEELNQQESNSDWDVKINKRSLPNDKTHALLPANQMKERWPTGPTELREWWTHWSEAQSSQSQPKKTVIHRSELTIYLGSTKV